MNLESREIRLPRRLVPSVRSADPASALDEAFASVTDADFRLDEAHAEPAENEMAATLRGKIADLKQQQQQLRRQLEGLVR